MNKIIKVSTFVTLMTDQSHLQDLTACTDSLAYKMAGVPQPKSLPRTLTGPPQQALAQRGAGRGKAPAIPQQNPGLVSSIVNAQAPVGAYGGKQQTKQQYIPGLNSAPNTRTMGPVDATILHEQIPKDVSPDLMQVKYDCIVNILSPLHSRWNIRPQCNCTD
jgi:hypothetical protein